MAEQPDWSYQDPQADRAPEPSALAGRRGPLTFVVAFAIAAILGIGWFVYRRPAPAAVQQQPSPTAPARQSEPAVVETRYDLPPLEDSDEFMRDRVGELSTHPLVASWMKTTGLVRNLAVVVENTSRGVSPARHLRVIGPRGPFPVLTRGTTIVADPRGYGRYDRMADAAGSLDAGMAAATYKAIKPLLQSGYDELGSQEPIDRAMERAIAGLLAAPVLDGPVPLTIGGEGVGYRFADPKLETLTSAQKQLIRMGPRNQRIVQEQLRKFAAAAGLVID